LRVRPKLWRRLILLRREDDTPAALRRPAKGGPVAVQQRKRPFAALAAQALFLRQTVQALAALTGPEEATADRTRAGGSPLLIRHTQHVRRIPWALLLQRHAAPDTKASLRRVIVFGIPVTAHRLSNLPPA